jgi:hypothetical protein
MSSDQPDFTLTHSFSITLASNARSISFLAAGTDRFETPARLADKNLFLSIPLYQNERMNMQYALLISAKVLYFNGSCVWQFISQLPDDFFANQLCSKKPLTSIRDLVFRK